MSSRDTLKAIENLQKERRKERIATGKGPVVTSRKAEASSNNTTSNKSNKKESPSNSTLKAIENLQKERRATRKTTSIFPAVEKSTVGNPPTASKTPLRVAHDAAYWEKRFNEEMDRLKIEHANDPGFPFAAHAIGIVEEEKKREEYITKHQNNDYDDNFFGQFAASYRAGDISERSSKAMADYLRTGDKKDYEYSYELDELSKRIQENNKDVYADDATLPWLSQDFAGYLPQLWNQTKAQAGGAVAGAGAGILLAPVTGGSSVVAGAKAGATAATGLHSYKQMQATAFKDMLELGLDEETALAYANDEAFVSALVEMGDTALALSSLGYGAIVKNLGKGATAKTVTSGLKGIGKAAGRYVLNIGQERAEEGIQGAFSVANRRRAYNEMTRKADEEIGQYGKGNVDLYNRPQYKNPDGTTATVESVAFDIDGEIVLLPSIDYDANGNAVSLTDEEAFRRYVETGEYLGKFKTKEEADAYANKLHLAQDYYYSDNKDEYADNGKWGLVKDAAKILYGVDFGTEDDETINEIKEQKRAGGAIAAIMGIPGTAVDVGANAYKARVESKVGKTYKADELIAEGLELDENSEAHKVAERLQAKQNAGQKISNAELVEAIRANERSIAQETQPSTLEEAAQMRVAETDGARKNTIAPGADLRYNEGSEGSVVNGREDDSGRNQWLQEEVSGEPDTESDSSYGKTETGIFEQGSTEGFGRAGLFRQDSEGRSINAVDSERIRDTVVKDETGRPKAVYHYTPEAEFTSFGKSNDIGFHFGSENQAMGRQKDLGTEGGRTFRVYLNLKNPIRVSEDIMGWKAHGTALKLWSDGVLTDSEMNEVTSLDVDGYDSPAAVRLREILAEKGYDGIVYPNGFEGDGDSYIAFSDDQIIKTENRNVSDDGGVADASGRINAPSSVVRSAPFNVMSNEAVGVRKTREAGIRSYYGFGEHGARTFADVMDSMPVDSIATRAFSAAYMAGRTNLSPELAELKTELQIKAFEAGLRDYNAETKSKEENVKNVVSHGKKAGFDWKGKPADATTTQMKIVDDLYKAMGVKGSLADGLLGNAELRTNIGISPIARDFQREIEVDGEKRKVSIVYHAAHEIAMHRLMELAPKEGQAFINALYRHMNVDSVKSLAEAKREAYAAQGVKISLSEAMEEVAANQILALYNWDEAKFAEAVDRIVNGKNEQAKQGASKFKQILDSVIAKLKSIIAKLNPKERQEVQAELDEFAELRDLFEKAFAAAVAKNKKIAANTTKKNLAIKTDKEYTGNTKFSAKDEKWRTDLTKAQLRKVEGWIAKEGNPEAKKITDTSYWYKGRLNGEDLFVIYSTEDPKGNTILYEVKGSQANFEHDILIDVLEVYENGESINGKSVQFSAIFGGGWMQQKNGVQNNIASVGRGQNNQNDRVLSGQPASNGSRALWNVIDNLLGKQGEIVPDSGNTKHSLRDSGKKYTEKEYRDYGWARANDILSVSENENYRSKFADLKSGQVRFNRSKNGEYIIPVSDSSSPDVENTLVFAKGTIDNPIITSIIKILEYDETTLDETRRYIYDLGRSGIQPKTGKNIIRYEASDFRNSWYGQTKKRYEDNYGERYGRGGEENTGFSEERDVNGKYSLRDSGKKYTEKEYRDYGWARANDILSVSENENYRSKFADLKSGQVRFNRSKNGEYIIPVSDSSSPDVENTLVFAKGTIDKPIITSIIKILEYNETTLDKVRRNIYGLERSGLQQKTGDSIIRYYASSFGTQHYREYLESRRYDNGDGIGIGNSGESSSYGGRTEGRDVNEKYSLRNQNEVSLQTMTNVRKAISDNDVTALAKYAEKGVISTEYYNQLVEQYGAIPKGENPHRDVAVPQKTEKNKKVSQTVRTILEAKATPDEAIPTIEKMVEDGIFSYDVYTDKQAIANTEAFLKEYGWTESYNEWLDAVNKGKVTKDTTVTGWALYNNAANIAATTTSETERREAVQTSLTILDAMVRHQRSAAQALQATRILKKLSPETQLYGVQKSVQSLQRELEERYGDKAPDLKIDEDLAEEFLNAKTQEERDAAEEKILKDIGRQMPSRFIDRWNAWRYLAMLGNARTHVRNVGGNAGFAPIVAVKNLTATAIESAVYRVSGKKTARSKAFVGGSKADRALLAAAWEDYANVADMISNGGKYSDFAMANQTIEEGRQIFKNKLLEGLRKGNSKLLEMEDMWFSKPHYAYALAQYCKANNITAEQLKRGKALGAAREYAIKEAQKATYRDTNEFSQWVSEVGRKKSDNDVAKAFKVVADGIMPFRKTPANILVRGLEYSPLGLLNGIKQAVWDVQRGEKTSAEAIDSISAGLTGTGLLRLGLHLAAQGLIRGHGEDDEEKEFKELMGHQAYALELPNGTSVTLDWLAPEALPFFVGVNIWEAKKSKKEDLNFSTILQIVSGITEPMLEMSCLQGLNDAVESVGYASSNDMSGLVSFLSSAATSYLTQGIPTILGQAERTGEENRMTTYTEKNAFLTRDMQYTLGKVSAKFPGWDYHQIPYIDAWGRKEASGNALKRGLNNFLNPAYTSTIETSSMEKELLRLYEKTGEGGVFPERADKYFTVDGKRKDLTAEEYVKYATMKGTKSYELVSDLVKSKTYKSLSDEEKAEAVRKAYDYANQKAKKAVANYKPETWVTHADKFGDNVSNFISFRTEVGSKRDDNGGKISKQEVVDIALGMAQSDSELWNMYLSEYNSKADVHLHEFGIEGEDYMSIIQNLDVVDKPSKSGKLGTYTNDEIAAAISMVRDLDSNERAELWQSMTGSTSTKNNPWR